MCGIAGYVGTELPESARAAIPAMLLSLARRGPDAEGTATWPSAILGHRRLSIFDLSDAGRQPMLSDDGQIGVLFNGAIYNFLELRADLEALGHRFRSRCDTEVLVRGYQQWGIDVLVPKLRGMFAFAVWDQPRRTLTLVRDRLGVKPLIYTTRNGAIAFASTVSALRQAGLTGEIDTTAVMEFLEFGWVTDDRTIYQGVSKLAAGTILEWRDGALTQRRYWTLPDVDENSRITFEEAVEETERILVESVKLRLEADVPVGALLSGGIDSSLVCWAMAKLNAKIKAFTVGTPGDDSDETAAAVETARILGIPHQVVDLSSSEAPSLDELISAYGEPFACSSALGMLRVSRAVKPMATVLLTGDGGDDVYLGYPFHKHFWMTQRVARSLPGFAPALWQTFRPLVDVIPPLRRPKHFLDYATGGLGAATRVFDGLPYYYRMGLLGERIASATIAQRQIPLSHDSARRLLSEYLKYEYRMRFVAEFMTKVDGGTMRHAIEARSPLLDHKLWEFAASLPFSVRLHGGMLKAVLREIARRRIGPQVAFRKKQGFTVPVGNWLAGRWKNRLQEEFASGSVLERDGWLRPGAIGEAITQAERRGQAPNQLWYLLVLECWMKLNGAGDLLPAQRDAGGPAVGLHHFPDQISQAHG
jgi:asparagine synthase (glutamine-hydrolysing)